MEIDTLAHKVKGKPKILTTVPSGRVCRLVGIAQDSFIRGHQRAARGRGRHKVRGGRHGLTGRNREMLRRLMDLGFTWGCVFEIVQGGRSGPVLVEIRGTRIALGHGIASQLLVEEVS
ncbi:MAG: ferrous iron transport protein A [Candidatus Thorarchaeota archaeon]|nr:ferrous iron transport protein A [Candidatus Thorarchaeota archaeon]